MAGRKPHEINLKSYAGRLGANLRKLRQKRGYNTITEFADALGIRSSTVGRWEGGLRAPRIKQLMQICAVLKCDLADLVPKS